MTLKHIKIFVTVYQEESITRAAEKLHMTQPATSLAIREMEEYYHTKLFERSGRGIRVTSAGTRLYPSAARLLSLYDEMDAEMKNWDTSGRLRIGSSISIGSCILPQLINRFSKKYPELELYVKVDSSDVIEQNILENHLDFALIEGSVHSEKLKSSVFLDDELVPVCSRGAPRGGGAGLELDSVYVVELLVREPNSGTRQLADSSFALKNFQIKPAWESTSTAALINAVSIGLGISILPKRMLEKQLRMHQIASFTIRDLDLKRHYSLIYHENKFVSPTMQEFFDMLEDIKG